MSKNSRWRERAAGAAILSFVLLLLTGTAAVAATVPTGSIRNSDLPNAIPNSYIVVFSNTGPAVTEGEDSFTRRLSAKYGATVSHIYHETLRGFAATLSPSVAKQLAAEPGVAYVEQDQSGGPSSTTEYPASWGLDRIDQRATGRDDKYTYPVTASNVTIYVVDSGIRVTHSDFGGRADWGYNATHDGVDTDCVGHGTHVAGTAGGTRFGVAKQVRLVAVKVIKCDVTMEVSDLVAAIDWVTQDHKGFPAVANLSLNGGRYSMAVNDAVEASIASGVTYTIASGNQNANACFMSPASAPHAITVNNSDSFDKRAPDSNYGPCTDIFAPGSNIPSDTFVSDTSTGIMSGTSMAAPHVAGAAAMILSENPTFTPAQVTSAIFDMATYTSAPGTPVIQDPGPGSPNRLLFVNKPTDPGLITVANPGNISSINGVSTSLRPMAVGGSGRYLWSATGLPPGLTIDVRSGTVSGTPTVNGRYTATIRAEELGGSSGTTTITWTVGASRDGTWACTVPPGYTWDHVSMEFNVCAPNASALSYRLRVPVQFMWACSVPPGWTAPVSQLIYGICAVGTARQYYLTRPVM